MIPDPSYNDVPSILWSFLEIVPRSILRNMNWSLNRPKIDTAVGLVSWVLRVRETDGHNEAVVHSEGWCEVGAAEGAIEEASEHLR
jgi:hypothetical protein